MQTIQMKARVIILILIMLLSLPILNRAARAEVWDLSAATYSTSSPNLLYAPRSVHFKSDGLKMYTSDFNGGRIYQYNLSSPYDITTASTTGYYSAADNPSSIVLSSDGTRMYILYFYSDVEYQYNLSTPWDITTATYNNVSKYVGSQDGLPYFSSFSPDGNKFYVNGTVGKKVYQYDLSTSWDLSTAIYNNKSLAFPPSGYYGYGASVSADGTKFYLNVRDSSSTFKKIFQYTLATPFDISTAIYDNIFLDPVSIDNDPRGFFLNPDGSRLYLAGSAAFKIHTFILSDGPVISSLSPADGTSDMGATDDLVITFNKTVTATSGSIIIKKSSDASTIETIPTNDTSRISGLGTAAITINPEATLDNDTEYYVQIDQGSFQDASDNLFAGITNSTSWNFSTRDITPPTIQASALTATSVLATSLNLSWTRGDGDRVIVFAKQTSVGTTTPVDNTAYTASTTFSAGNQIGSSGWYAVYVGTGTGSPILGLSPETDYTFQAFEYDLSGSNPLYLMTTSDSSPLSQRTAAAPTTNTFTYTGGEQSFTVPTGVNQITIKAWGAGGAGRTGSYSTYSGGSGGYAEAQLTATSGETLIIVVGGGGQYGSAGGGLGGWPSGGYGTAGDASGGGGGGLTGVFRESYAHSNALIVTGGGGGGGYNYGGAGGGTSGNSGQSGGTGGTQSAGGTGTSGSDGIALFGGNGDSRGSRLTGSYDGGGGGGGYYGGEGGYSDAGGGGGGSGYVNQAYSSTRTLTVGTNGTTADVNPPNATDENYVSGIGIGKRGAYNGGNGLVVISYASSSPSEPEDTTSPQIENVIVYTSTTGAIITWETDEDTSALVNYGLTADCSTTTSESDTSPRDQEHAVTIPNLVPCTRYYYKAQSTDANNNVGTTSIGTFKTTGCTGDSAVTATGQGSATRISGGSVNHDNISLTIPAAFKDSVSSAIFQANKLDATAFYSTAGTPDGLARVGTNVYTLKAFSNENTAIPDFDSAISIIMTYSDSDIEGLDEETLWIHRYNGSSWNPLNNCLVDSSANTVTCETQSFSDFAVFGQAAETPAPATNQVSGSATKSVSQIISRKKTYRFTRNLLAGVTHPEVRLLQQFLNNNGFIITRTGLGSPGRETNFFGPLTRRALIRFQRKNKISPAVGYFGPITREEMNKSSL